MEEDVYDLFQRGMALLKSGDFAPATVPLSKAARIEPEKTSIREALGRAYFRSRQFEEAAVEFQAVVERAPTNDYALFCLGRSLLACGRPADARMPLGGGGAVYATREGSGHVPAIQTDVVDESGAGAAMTAGIICGLMQGFPADEAVGLGAAAASLTLLSSETVRSDLSLQHVYEHLVV